MKLRTVVLTLAGLGIPLALLVLVLPITWGYGGYIERPSQMVYVDPTGPAARAGIHVGDRIERPRGADAIQEDSGNVGTVAHIRVVGKDERIRVHDVTFVPFTGSLAVQQQLDKILGGLTALGTFIIAILVVLRARDPRAGARAALVLLLAGIGALCQAAALVCGNAWIGTIYWIAPMFFSGAIVWAALRLLAIYPPSASRMRTILGRLSFLPLLWAFTQTAFWLYGTWTGSGVAAFSTPGVNGVFDLLFYLMLCIAIVDGMRTAGPAYVAAMRWLGGMWLIAVALGSAPVIARISNAAPALGYSHYADLLRGVEVFCLAFGIAYPVLRHRMVDLNILVSRASVFTVVSAIIVGIFIAAEWAIGKIFERSMGLSSESGGVAAQILTLAVVLVLGISARSIHGFVEDRMSKTFFRKRMRGLAEIERIAREADAATDAPAVRSLAVATVQHCLEPLGTALYVRSGDRYDRTDHAGSFVFPATYGFNEEPPLRLRRFQEAFEIDDDSDERHHMLFVPMTLRGELLGFLSCGPKADRTAYLPDEISALTLLAHHIGIASAMLARAPASSLSLVAT